LVDFLRGKHIFGFLCRGGDYGFRERLFLPFPAEEIPNDFVEQTRARTDSPNRIAVAIPKPICDLGFVENGF
jgi:hypothetical protein